MRWRIHHPGPFVWRGQIWRWYWPFWVTVTDDLLSKQEVIKALSRKYEGGE